MLAEPQKKVTYGKKGPEELNLVQMYVFSRN
jgi:hypothetical protein